MENEIIQLQKIGTVYSPHKNSDEAPRQPRFAAGIRGKVIIEPQYVEGLRDLEGFSHIYLICFLHQSKGYHLTAHPPLDNKSHGVFASRSPHRPNPISLSVVRLISIEDNELTIENVDILDGTPVLDIKPFSPTFDIHDDFKFGWIEESDQNFRDFLSKGQK
jgi:tRNA-Thr(GGU) m(6)t(6)A37 methyltransferase TsaA